MYLYLNTFYDDIHPAEMEEIPAITGWQTEKGSFAG